VDVGSIGRTTYKLLSCDCVRVASQDPEEELAASNFLTISGVRGRRHIGRTTYKLLSCDCVRVASQDPEEELAASNFLTIGIRAQVSCSDRRARFCSRVRYCSRVRHYSRV
jgi:hypothetical protein